MLDRFYNTAGYGTERPINMISRPMRRAKDWQVRVSTGPRLFPLHSILPPQQSYGNSLWLRLSGRRTRGSLRQCRRENSFDISRPRNLTRVGEIQSPRAEITACDARQPQVLSTITLFRTGRDTSNGEITHIRNYHRAINRRCASMAGFRSFANAAITIAGIELAQRIRKGQFSFGRGRRHRGWSRKGEWATALA